MFDVAQGRIITMQYSVVMLLVIISFWASGAFKERAFRIIALGWLVSLAYLASNDSNQGLWKSLGLPDTHRAVPSDFFDFTATTLFWFAAHKHGKSGNRLYFSKWSDRMFLSIPVTCYLASTISVHVFPQARYLGFLASALPTVLADGFAITALAFYLRELANRSDNAVPDKSNLLFGATLLYAMIQALQMVAFGQLKGKVLAAGFVLGLAAKVLIFLGIIRLLVASAEALSSALAEQERAQELTTAIGLLGHEMGTPIGEIKLGVAALSQPSNLSDGKTLRSIESATSRLAAILQSSKFAVAPTTDALNKSKAISVNTLIEIAQGAVKTTRPKTRVHYSHSYSASCCIECVPSEIVQVLINILRNAYDAIEQTSEEGRIDIRTLNEKVTADNMIASDKGMVRVVVRDNGEGIRTEIMANIFEQGYTTRDGPGRGYGLAESKRLVEASGGKIGINSPPRGSVHCGTEVIMAFPRVDCVL